MGAFREPIRLVAGPDGPSADPDAPVDAGATCTLAPAPILRRPGVKPIGRRTFGDNAEALPGAVTLEELGPGVDPVARRLAPVHGRPAGLHPGGGR